MNEPEPILPRLQKIRQTLATAQRSIPPSIYAKMVVSSAVNELDVLIAEMEVPEKPSLRERFMAWMTGFRLED